jgi:phenylpyruvate tautomerase PptA (4-oxalocrotonate tautomerase family)
MPLITVTVRKPKTPAFKAGVLKAIHAALVASGVPEKDRFHRVLELDARDFNYDDTYPDLTSPRGRGLRADRNPAIRRPQREGEAQDPCRPDGRDREGPGVNPENVMVVFKETQWENWAFGGGRQIHA